MARTDYARQLATAYSAIRGLENDPAVFDAEWTALVASIAAKVDVGDTALQTLLGALAVPAGATGAQVPQRQEMDTALALKADLASPTFTGTPTLPTGTIAVTQASGDNSTALATTAYADLKADLASPALTGVPTAPTAAVGTSTTQLATTAFVAAAVDAEHTRAWADVSASRTFGVAYTNTSGHDIEVSIGLITGTTNFDMHVDGVFVGRGSSTDNIANSSFTVPNGSSYTVTKYTGAGSSVIYWAELG